MRKENVLKSVLEIDTDLFWEDLRPSQAGHKWMAHEPVRTAELPSAAFL